MSPTTTRNAQRLLLAMTLIGLGAWQFPALALTDLSDMPLASSSSAQVKPNIFFILDDSGSMDSEYMPDALSGDSGKAGYRNHLCNTIYYNPAVTYVVPKDGAGVNLHNAAPAGYTAACSNGFSSSACSTDLGTKYHWEYVGSATNLAWPTSGSNDCTLTADTTKTGICNDGTYVTNSPASCTAPKTLVWKRVTVTSASADAQNYANWYSYYRTRLMMMKASAGRAFQSIGDNYRVGFMTISPDTYDNDSGSSGAATGRSVDANKFLKISDFDATHRTNWYTKLYSQSSSSYTPLRSALATAGRYYAGKNDLTSKGMVPTQADDPTQYSCQQNFTILTTDGYWNSGSGRQLNGTSEVGNQDGVISELDAYNPTSSKFAVSPRPMYDGATALYTWNAASNQYRNVACAYGTQWQQRTIQYQICSATTQAPSVTTMLRQDSGDYGAHYGNWYIDAGCSVDSDGRNRTNCNSVAGLLTRTSSDGGGSWGSWAANPTDTCESDNAGNGRRQCTGGTVSALRTTSNGNSSNPTWTAWTAASSCSEDSSGDNRRECRYVAAISYTCSGSWSNGQCTNTDPGTLPVCQSSADAWADVGSCTPAAQDGSGVATECQEIAVTGSKTQSLTTITHKDYPGPNQTGTQIGSTRTDPGAWTDSTPATCYATAPALPADGAVTGVGPPDPPANCTSGSQVWPCENMSASGGSTDTLADVAQYYYKTDLRTSALGNCTGALGVSVCDNNVPSAGTNTEDDKANWQHMTTFTMGLGLSGTLSYSPTYKTDSSGTFANIRSGSTNWPVPSAGGATALDDLWHAAVNGRGQYFSAANPESVIDSLNSALSGISARVASAAAAATSNLEPVAGDNFAYTAKYVTQRWTGELEAHEIDLGTGAVSGTVIWSAATKLDAVAKPACDNRTIKLFRSGGAYNLVDFKWSTYACDAGGSPTGSAVTTLDATEQGNFSATQIALLSQYPNMGDGTGSTVNQRAAAPGANLVNYIRGQSGKQGFDSGPPATNTDVNKLYRTRDRVLGDVINAQPVFVKAPFGEYLDAGYVNFRTSQANRTPMVYVAANDGMLHAFYAGTSIADTQGGVEAWAFMPTMVLPNLYKLASENYDTHHQFYVDGTPSAADVFDRTASADCALGTPAHPENCWKTILVGGLNKGGQGYYALDITDPATPKALWEFKNSDTCVTVNATTKAPTSASYTDCHIGYTYNNPIIGKLADGTWVVFVTSGYNNDDGIGYLYVLNAITGQVLYRISTGSGSAGSPSGLNHINAWVENGVLNNTIVRVYGVDLDGNIWRFDVNDVLEPSGREATLVAQVVDSGGTPQAITTKPELAEVSGAPFVYVATGRYLGTTDTSTTQTQTVWAIKDPLTTTAVANLRATLGARTIANVGSGTTAYRTVTASSCTTGDGWYADLPDTGERVNIDIKLQLGTLVVPSNVPVSNACNIGGYGWLNYFNYTTGCAIANSPNASVGQRLVGASGTESLAVGINIVRLPGGKTVVIATTSAAEQITFQAPFDTPPPVGKRVSWRELVQ